MSGRGRLQEYSGGGLQRSRFRSRISHKPSGTHVKYGVWINSKWIIEFGSAQSFFPPGSAGNDGLLWTGVDSDAELQNEPNLMHVDFYPIPDPASRKHKPSPDFRPKWLKFIPNFNPVNTCPWAFLILYFGEGGGGDGRLCPKGVPFSSIRYLKG